VTCTVNFHNRFYSEYKFVQVNFETPPNTLTVMLNVGHTCNARHASRHIKF